MDDEETLEKILVFLEPFGPDLKNGLSNHAPMACEALLTMGKKDSIFPWLERYGNQFMEKKKPRNKIYGGDWKTFLGIPDTYPEWEIFFNAELEGGSWQNTLSEWAVKLAPGICADATHGVIRTGHAVRSLSRKETKRKKRELASGLAVWASAYLELPTSFDSLLGLQPEDAIQKVDFIPEESKNFSGTIVSSLQGLGEYENFAPVIGYLNVSDEPEEIISGLSEVFSRVVLNNVEDTLSAIVFIHSVTSASALRSILPFLNEYEKKSVLRYSWQSGAALFSTFGKRSDLKLPEKSENESRQEMIERAIEHGDEHAIKFTEVCLKEYEYNPSPAYYAAARLVRKYLEPLPQ
ncbi:MULTISPECIES: questin oxidase family protein [unclassified Leptospira]|uniref:questin oxidase family protein n=1 Tax=unclassified Leptospira TaxID=2633828 RepID=UPI0002BD4B6D|nr:MULTISPECIES: questin oxidase family protein [unclassified Leptospira]EMJ98838.1 PF14027 family protein [Leptospira sp. B5-022]MCR1794717.1 questin oxidase family protein [Leptospira sp. id769339]